MKTDSYLKEVYVNDLNAYRISAVNDFLSWMRFTKCGISALYVIIISITISHTHLLRHARQRNLKSQIYDAKQLKYSLALDSNSDKRIIFANLFLNVNCTTAEHTMTTLQHLHGRRHTVLTRTRIPYIATCS
jgi:hypothetical protein